MGVARGMAAGLVADILIGGAAVVGFDRAGGLGGRACPYGKIHSGRGAGDGLGAGFGGTGEGETRRLENGGGCHCYEG